MKFRDAKGVINFLLDSEQLGYSIDYNSPEYSAMVESLELPEEVVNLGISRIRKLITPLKDVRKSRAAKTSWKRHRHNFMAGIKRFHKSTEGKRFHRTLGNYLAIKDTAMGNLRTDRTRNEDLELLKSVNSALTHGVIELEYFEGLYENLEYEMFYEESFFKTLQSIVNKISNSEDLVPAEIDYLYRIVDESCMLQAIANHNKKSLEEVLKEFMSVNTYFQNSKYDSIDESGYYLDVYNKLKKQLASSVPSIVRTK